MPLTGWTVNPAVAAQRLVQYSTPEMGVEVGVLDTAQDYPADETGLSNAVMGYASKVVMVAHFHETAPESRAYNKWLYKSLMEAQSDTTREMIKVLKRSGRDVRKRRRLMAELGDALAKDVQDAVQHRKISIGPNAAATLEQKQGTVPMLDTKHLISVIDSEVYG